MRKKVTIKNEKTPSHHPHTYPWDQFDCGREIKPGDWDSSKKKKNSTGNK
jgi:hypothetical protein